MICPYCQHEPPAGSTFCNGCGAKLELTCANCGALPPPGSRFCNGCGATLAGVPSDRPAGAPSQSFTNPSRAPRTYTPQHLAEKILHSKSALEGERKQVTVLFADIQGSLQLASELDPERWHQLLERYFALLTEAVHRFEGTVNQYTGDGIMALFGAPIAHEDHAQRACYAALQARDQLRTFADELRLSEGLNFGFRMGLNSGDVVVGKIGDDLRMDYTAQGATVGIAQRMEQLAAPGSVYLSGATERLVAGYFQLRPLGKADLKGLTEALSLFELEAPGRARSRLEVAVTRGLSVFVGRSAELRHLDEALSRAQRGHGQVIGIVGEPGLGKSRLCLEFVAQCRRQGLPVYEAHCPAHGKNIPYLPILDLFRNYFGIKADDTAAQARDHIAHTLRSLDPGLAETLPVLYEFMGVSDPDHPTPPIDPEAKQRRLYDLVHRVMQAQDARGQLTVTLIDDLHWVDAGSEAFVHQLVNAAAGRRALVVLNFRPEYVAAFTAKAHYQQLPLIPLGEVPLSEMIAVLIGRDPSVTALTARIIEWTGGNPFYTEELINGLIEAGDLTGHPGQYQLATLLERLAVPTNVRAVLAARIDRLPDTAKRLLQTAAVIGKEFNDPVLAAVTDLSPSEQLSAMERLQAGDFIVERALYPVIEYAFKHPLTHEVAYQSQLHSRRMVVHAAVARALEAQAGDKLEERAALLAHHCEAAGEVLNAARWHQRAAEWAGMNDLKAALHHWQRVRELARQRSDAVESIALMVAACSHALIFGWRLGDSTAEWPALFADGCIAAERAGDLSALAMLNMNYSSARGLNQGDARDYAHYAREAVRIADRTPDLALRCATRAYLCFAHTYCGELRDCEKVANELIALAGDDPDLGAAVGGLSPLLAAEQSRLWCIGFSRDPRAAIAGARLLRQRALTQNYRDQAGWVSVVEGELTYALGRREDTRTLAQIAMDLAKDRGAGMEIMAASSVCNVLALEGEWQSMLKMANDTLQQIRDSGAMRLWEPFFLAHIGTAQFGLGAIAASRRAGHEAVEFMRRSQCLIYPRGYAILARAQLTLAEPAADIAFTLDEYEALLTRTGLHVYEGELDELRAQLAEREGQHAAQAATLARAHDCYTRLGMSVQAARVAPAIKLD